MDRSLEEIYKSISQIILRGIEGEFSEAILEVELHSLALKLSGGYHSLTANESRSFIFLKENKKLLIKDLIELHKKTDLDEKSRWNTMTYDLFSNGKYKVEFLWNQSLADKIESVCTEV